MDGAGKTTRMTPLVLIPGMMCDSRLYAPQIAAINDRAVMVAPIVEAETVEALARGVLDVAPPQFALAGLSMGGIVAMEILRQAPARVERICLMDTNPFAETDKVKAMREPQMERAAKGDLAQMMQEQMIPNYLHSEASRPDIEVLCLDMALGLGAEVFLRQSKALRDRPDQSETLRSFCGKALILQGEDDRLCPHSRHEAMHEMMPQSEYMIIKGAGHLPTLETPNETNAVLQKWLCE